jgi:hypothetical protein
MIMVVAEVDVAAAAADTMGINSFFTYLSSSFHNFVLGKEICIVM